MGVNSSHYVGSTWPSNGGSYNWDVGLICYWNAGLSSTLSHWDDAGRGPRALRFGIVVGLRRGRRALLRRELRAPRLAFVVMLRRGLRAPRLGFAVMLSSLASWHCINDFYQPCVWSMGSAFDDLFSVIFRQSTTVYQTNHIHAPRIWPNVHILTTKMWPKPQKMGQLGERLLPYLQTLLPFQFLL